MPPSRSDRCSARLVSVITTDQEYDQSREKLASLVGSIASTEAGAAGDDEFRDLQLSGLRSFADDLRTEIADYETQQKRR